MARNLDLHRLTKKHGTAFVAGILGCSPRALEELRRGGTALTIDDLYELSEAFPGFDLLGTVRTIAGRRAAEGWSRKAKAHAKGRSAPATIREGGE